MTKAVTFLPEEVLEQLKAEANPRKQRSLDILKKEICEKQVDLRSLFASQLKQSLSDQALAMTEAYIKEALRRERRMARGEEREIKIHQQLPKPTFGL